MNSPLPGALTEGFLRGTQISNRMANRPEGSGRAAGAALDGR